MRKIAIGLMLICTVGLSSCLEKVLKNCDAACENHGFCDETTGTCDCDMGYEGTNCDIETRARFLGNYNVLEDSSGTIKNYTCIVSNGKGAYGPYGITITSLNGSSIDGKVTENNSINLDHGSGDFFNVQGSGNLNGNTINLNIVFTPNGFNPTYTKIFTLTK
ncbi:MAG: hypothetical protein IPI46_08505 [Bacteroidetes bacterium]|nr:hypothetical protein [Bacteroidota bacterium]